MTTRTIRYSAGQTAAFAADVDHSYQGTSTGAELLMTVHLPQTPPAARRAPAPTKGKATP
jgi:hypothetical protein